MAEKLITKTQALEIFNKKSDKAKVKILMAALLEECDLSERAEHLIITNTGKIAYTDEWHSDEEGFYYKKY